MAASDVSVAVGAVLTLAPGILECSPSLNSPRSNLQTTAEFWQILPRCLLPLGDTFFIYFSSPPLWYSLHGALAPRAIVSSVFLPCLKNQMDLQGLLSTPPFFSGLMNVANSSISFSFICTLSTSLWRLGLSSDRGVMLLRSCVYFVEDGELLNDTVLTRKTTYIFISARTLKHMFILKWQNSRGRMSSSEISKAGSQVPLFKSNRIGNEVWVRWVKTSLDFTMTDGLFTVSHLQ